VQAGSFTYRNPYRRFDGVKDQGRRFEPSVC